MMTVQEMRAIIVERHEELKKEHEFYSQRFSPSHYRVKQVESLIELHERILGIKRLQ